MLSDGNGECKITDESTFFKSVGQKMLYYTTEYEDKLKDYRQVELLTLRLFENIEQHIKTLEAFKRAGYEDIEALEEREDI